MSNKYDPLIGRFHGTRTILFEFIARYTTLRKLDIHHYFFVTHIGGYPAIVGIRKSRSIPSVAWVWCSDDADRSIALEHVAGIIHSLDIPEVLTAVPSEYAKGRIVERITWMRRDI